MAGRKPCYGKEWRSDFCGRRSTLRVGGVGSQLSWHGIERLQGLAQVTVCGGCGNSVVDFDCTSA